MRKRRSTLSNFAVTTAPSPGDGNTITDAINGGGARPANTRLGSNLRILHDYMELDQGLSGRERGALVTIDFCGRLPSVNRCEYNRASRTCTCGQPGLERPAR